jgi:hypothetical protein
MNQLILIILAILIIFLIYEIISSIQIKNKITIIKQKISQTSTKKKLYEEKKRNEKIITSKDQLRSLSREIGGLEVDYEKIQQESEVDKDPWDQDFDEANIAIEEDEEGLGVGTEFDSSSYKSFIYKKKKGKGKKGKKMGPMTLDDVGNKDMGHLEKLNKARKARLEKGDEEGVSF